MDHAPHRDRRGPQLYFHVEFGISWSRQGPRSREVVHRSRGMRQRAPAFPRHVPARNTNYLAAIRDFQTCQQPDSVYLDANQAYYHAQQRASPPPPPLSPRIKGALQANEQRSRQSRSSSRSSHERGRSAPPPFGNNPWDVNVPSPRRQPSGLPGSSANVAAAEQWKPLPSKPSDPSQFRLGEDSMPWSAWSWPSGCDSSAEPPPAADGNDDDDDDDDEWSTHNVPFASRAERAEKLKASHPEEVSTFSPGTSTELGASSTSTATVGLTVEDPEGKKELESLSAAMMTVDNGFENQWWNQGKRASFFGGLVDVPEHHRAAAARQTGSVTPDALFSEHRRGWAMVSPTLGTEWHSLPVSAQLISPMSPSERSGCDLSLSGLAQLQRTMSTRSEELFSITAAEGRDSDFTPS